MIHRPFKPLSLLFLFSPLVLSLDVTVVSNLSPFAVSVSHDDASPCLISYSRSDWKDHLHLIVFP